jgi:muramoyltetrapeptide carboxypeptidase LdcA involved in peptidoglycan recycling
MNFLKPPRFQPGDTVAAISLSSGVAGQFPQVYEAAKHTLKEMFSLELIQTPNALRDDDWLYQHP